MFFDLHTDILFDIVKKRIDGKKNIIKNHHVTYLQKGDMTGGIWCYYTDLSNRLCEFDQAIDYILEELELAADIVNVVKQADDFCDHKLNVILGFESLVDVKDLNQFKTLYNQGFRHAMLTWNEENQYGTGVLGNSNRGLTERGKEIIRFMEQHNMIVDVSHQNKKTFYDTLAITKKPVLASHSNVQVLFNHVRNLDRNQIKKIMDSNGLIGLTPVWKFLANDETHIKTWINHLNYLKDMGAIDQIGFGCDFMYYLDDAHANLIDFSYPIDTAKLKMEIYEAGFTEEDVKKITHKNALQFLEQVL